MAEQTPPPPPDPSTGSPPVSYLAKAREEKARAAAEAEAERYTVPPKEKGVKVLLVIDFSTNWYQEMKDVRLSNGDKVVVEQTKWKNINLLSSTEDGCVLYLRKEEEPWPLSSQKEDRVVRPDFLLIRNFPTQLHEPDGFRNIIMGLMLANLPSVNSLHSVFMGCHRPLQVAEMVKAEQRVRKLMAERKAPPSHVFRTVPMRYYPCSDSDQTAEDAMNEVFPKPRVPAVVKVGTAHAGYGKMKVTTQSEMDDLSSILRLNKSFYTVEPLIEFEYEYRIQKIGSHYRCFKRNTDSGWKGNWGNLRFEDHPCEEHHVIWANECAKAFGGLDITALDMLHCKDGSAILLETNDTACGLMYEHEAEDTRHIKELVLQRMEEAFA